MSDTFVQEADSSHLRDGGFAPLMGDPIVVGIDVVRVDQVLDSLLTFGQRYLDRVYTTHEQDSCTGTIEVRARSLAARFAAKEAAMKVLRPTDEVPPWTSIEVRRRPEGWPELRLSGKADDLAESANLATFTLSMAHEDDVAVAMVVATRRPPDVFTDECPRGTDEANVLRCKIHAAWQRASSKAVGCEQR